LLTHKEGKYPEDGSGPGAVSLEGRHGMNQTGGNTTEPSLEQNQPNTPKTGSRTSSRTVPELVSPSIQARAESVSVNPLTPRP